jgi:hypothetical protein
MVTAPVGIGQALIGSALHLCLQRQLQKGPRHKAVLSEQDVVQGSPGESKGASTGE